MALAAIGIGAHGLISVASNEIPAGGEPHGPRCAEYNWAEARELERIWGPLFDAISGSRIPLR